MTSPVSAQRGVVFLIFDFPLSISHLSLSEPS
jgi:hypothetical protein